jgi:hypothetical protein
MPSLVKWSALGTHTKIINGDATAPTLKNLANAARKLGSEVDGASSRDRWADFVLRCKFGVAPTSGGYVELFIVQAVDGTTYQDGDDSLEPPPGTLVGIFSVRTVTTQQVVAIRGVLLPATKWKPVVFNRSGQAMTNTDNENELHYRPYNEESQ